jgi:hypothetical protein
MAYISRGVLAQPCVSLIVTKGARKNRLIASLVYNRGYPESLTEIFPTKLTRKRRVQTSRVVALAVRHLPRKQFLENGEEL